jgi:cytochrome c oxidase subunit 2
MGKKKKFVTEERPAVSWRWLGGSLALGLFLGGCANIPGALDPKGPVAAEIATLSWLMFGLATVIFLIVMGLLLYILFWRARRETAEEPEPNPALDRKFIIWGGIVIPTIILVALFFFNLWTMAAIAAPAGSDEIVIEMVGHQFWWEVHYPDQRITTANEIHLPVGRPVQLRLTSADVIHSFWVPELTGKMDLLPNRVNSFWIQADQAGTYYGECAEFCGIQHAKMAFIVVAEPEEQFAAWLVQQAQPAPEPTDEIVQRGQQIFLGSACVYCHTIKGTNATGTLGPDLTHLASRYTLAAGTVENNSGNLAGWIIDPHSIKPGNLMPPTNLTGPELQALLAYLETLE